MNEVFERLFKRCVTEGIILVGTFGFWDLEKCAKGFGKGLDEVLDDYGLQIHPTYIGENVYKISIKRDKEGL